MTVLYQLLITLNRWYADTYKLQGDNYVHPDFFRFRSSLEQKFLTHHQVADYVGMLRISPAQLNKLCRQYGGLSAQKMIHHKPLSEIKKALRGRETISEIAYTFGFSDPSNFLDDLLVTQCLFAGDPDVLPLHLGVIANGQGLVVDHCVFFRCRNSVVFWRANGTSHHNAMQYCLVYGGYFSGVWTTQSTGGDDFEFHHNVIAQCRTAWIRENGSTRQYKAHDCLFAGNNFVAGYGSGPAGGGGPF